MISDEQIVENISRRLGEIRRELTEYSRRIGNLEEELSERLGQLKCTSHTWVTVGPGLNGITVYKCQKCGVPNSDEDEIRK